MGGTQAQTHRQREGDTSHLAEGNPGRYGPAPSWLSGRPSRRRWSSEWTPRRSSCCSPFETAVRTPSPYSWAVEEYISRTPSHPLAASSACGSDGQSSRPPRDQHEPSGGSRHQTHTRVVLGGLSARETELLARQKLSLTIREDGEGAGGFSPRDAP